jgi:hypothetical protein
LLPPGHIIQGQHHPHLHQLVAAHTDDYIASIGTNYGYTRAYCEGNRTYFGGDMMFCPRAILYTAATAYTTTN